MQLSAENPIIRSALLDFLRIHEARRGSADEIYERSTADDFCGVSYRLSYQRHDTQAATIAVRSKWPWQLELDLLDCMTTVCEEGPHGISLTPTSVSSAILSWNLAADDGESEDTLAVISWLARIRCVLLTTIIDDVLHRNPRVFHVSHAVWPQTSLA